jgi:uncharacterized protein (TIGR03545 family)
MIRWKGLIALAVIVAIFAGLALIFTDQWLEDKIENSGSFVVGAKVDIDHLSLSFTDMQLKWDRLQITDASNTMKNIIETGECKFDLEFWPLLSRKVIIENFTISGVKTNTNRETDGKLEKERSFRQLDIIGETAKDIYSEVSANINAADFKEKINADSLFALVNITSVKKMERLKKNLSERYHYWEQTLKNNSVEKDAQSIIAKAKAIEVKNLKNIKKLQANLKTLNEIKKSSEKLYGQLADAKAGLSNDFEMSKDSLRQIDKWIEKDYQQAKGMAKLPDFSTQNLAKLIFGKSLADQLNTYLGYAAIIREYASSSHTEQPPKEEPPRLKGQNIYFYNPNARPDFWIKHLELSGETGSGLKLSGGIKNIVSDQRFVGKPTIISINATSEKGLSLAINGQLNYLTETPQENFQATYSGFSLAGVQLSKNSLLPNAIEKGKGIVNASLDLKGDYILCQVKLDAAQLKFSETEKSKNANKLTQLVQNTLSEIKRLDMRAAIKGVKGNLDISVQSSLDEALANNFKSTLSKEINAAKQKIKTRIDKETAKYKNELTAFVKTNEQKLKTQLSRYQNEVKKAQKEINDKKKQINDKIKKEQKQIEKGLKDKIKNLF